MQYWFLFCSFNRKIVNIFGMNIQKQIAYWINGANEDLSTAQLLIGEKKILHGLFFCHLVIEKAIKAHVVKNTSDVAPRSHNLIYLIELTNLELTDETQIFLGILMKYQLQGRYPDYNPVLPEQEQALIYLKQTNDLLQWLNEKL